VPESLNDATHGTGAKAFPKSTFIGYDFHPSSIEEA